MQKNGERSKGYWKTITVRVNLYEELKKRGKRGRTDGRGRRGG